jgi:hypothetical protein
MTVAVGVYEKAGLCRGPLITDARFWREAYLGYLAATPPGPLDPDPVYTVAHPAGVFSWQLRVDSPVHQSWGFWVQDGERHEVWLDRRPGF